MGTIATAAASGVCCCLSCCCQGLADSMKKLLGAERVTKMYYLLLIMIYMIPAILFFFLINNWQSFFDYFNGYIKCPTSSESSTGFQCIGASGVYRLSFSLLCLFITLMLWMLCRNQCALVINEGLFCFKYLFVVALFIGLLWVNNTVFTGYAIFSQYASIVFMILQSIILIDLFYLAGIRLVKRYDEGEGQCAVVLIILTVIFEGAAITMNVLGYIYSIAIFNTADGCGSSLWVNIVTTLILILLPVLQLFNFNNQNSLLTTAMVSLYISYLAFISQFSYTNGNQAAICNRMELPALLSDVLVSSMFFMATMYGTIMGGTGQVKVTQDGDINKAVGLAPAESSKSEAEQPESKANQEKKEEDEEQANQEKYHGCTWILYHFHMCMASIYIGMLITNWGSTSIVTGELKSDGFGFWIRVAISWVTTIIYIWTLIAPKIFPGRDFQVK